MTTKLMKAAVIMLASIALIATAGAASAADCPVQLKLNISTGQITEVGGSYEGYIYLEPTAGTANINTIWYNLTEPSLTGVQVEIIKETTDAVSAWGAIPVYGRDGPNPINKYKVNIQLDGNKTITEPTLIGKIKITPASTHLVTDSCELNFSADSYVATVITPGTDPIVKNKGDNLPRVGYILNGSVPNTIIAGSDLEVTTEDHNETMDDKLIFFSELTNELTGDDLSAVNPTEFKVDYKSADETILKFYANSTALKQNYVVLTGSKTVLVTANLTNATNDEIMQTLPVIITTKKADITVLDDPKGTFFNYTNATYPYSGESVADLVLAEVTAGVLNHSKNADDTEDGYARVISPITIKFYNDSAYLNEDEPIAGGKYYFKINITENDNYEELTLYEIENNNFTIQGNAIKPNFVMGIFDAEHAATVTAYYNTTEELLPYAVLMNASVPAYKFRNNPTARNLPYAADPLVNLTETDVISIPDDKKNITFVNATVKPTEAISIVKFEGKKLGDANLDGDVDGLDGTYILTTIAADPSNPPFSEEAKFYGNVYGNSKITAIDARAIAQYSVGQVDAEYKAIPAVV